MIRLLQLTVSMTPYPLNFLNIVAAGKSSKRDHKYSCSFAKQQHSKTSSKVRIQNKSEDYPEEKHENKKDTRPEQNPNFIQLGAHSRKTNGGIFH